MEWANFTLVAFGYLPELSPIKQNHFDRAVPLADHIGFIFMGSDFPGTQSCQQCQSTNYLYMRQ